MRERLYVVSSNSTDTPATLSTRLQDLRLKIAAEHPRSCLRLYGSWRLRGHASEHGLDIFAPQPDRIPLAGDMSFGYGDLEEIIALAVARASLMVTNPDHTHPGPDGLAVPETGALLTAVRACLPDLTPGIVGKPEPSPRLRC
ncbi:MAG: hypothetical protein AAGC57_12395 [Pseudomonadota bacterium]